MFLIMMIAKLMIIFLSNFNDFVLKKKNLGSLFTAEV